MRKSITKIAAVVALAAIVVGSSSNVAFAHHGRGHRAVVQNPAPVCYADGSCDVDGVCIFGVACDGTVHHTAVSCYADGSCDVDGVCIFGVDCDGTVHHAEPYHYGGTGHHGGHH